MRIWSLHPRYLDAKGLVALWREALLAKHVLEGRTKGYQHHPQLERFKKAVRPLHAINQYLTVVFEEAEQRGYHFDGKKIDRKFRRQKINVTEGQIEYERSHLMSKLRVRDRKKYNEIHLIDTMEPHMLFRMVDGGIESWEKLTHQGS